MDALRGRDSVVFRWVRVGDEWERKECREKLFKGPLLAVINGSFGMELGGMNEWVCGYSRKM